MPAAFKKTSTCLQKITFHCMQFAKKAAENRKKILEAFAEIPIILAAAHFKQSLYPEDGDLRACVEKLSFTILVSVSGLVGALLPDRHSTAAILRPDEVIMLTAE
jgi:hypothetical protein